MICNICPRRCNIDRDKESGICRSPNEFRLARAALHYWEEPCISGKNGSGTIFFSGCNLGCVFCQNYEISHENKGEPVTESELIDIIKDLENQGANNINLVNPTHYAVGIAKVLKKYKPSVPVVYNTSGYERVETLKMLEGLVDIYLPDYKYIRPDKALRYSNAADYPAVVKSALKEMRRQVPTDIFDEDGIMQKGMIIRHLILPSNTNLSTEIIDDIRSEFGNAYISLMAQYMPMGDLTKCKEIDRKISKREYKKVIDYAEAKGLTNVFVQELSSADEGYIPSFDFTGIKTQRRNIDEKVF